MSSSRLTSIATAMAYTGAVHIYGDLPVSDRDFIAKYASIDASGLRVVAEGSTAISYLATDGMDAKEKAIFFESLISAEIVVIHGIDPADKHFFENLAFARGFRIHPAYFAHVGYDEAFDAGYWCILQKLRPEAATSYSNEWLLENRSLHMDMTRESGLRSDAHMIRYVYASGYIRPGDVVLDCASGLGYGSNIMRTLSDCSAVVGRDISERAVRYACDNFVQSGLAFEVGDAQSLSNWEDNSVDTFISFETLEHVPEPEKVIAEAARVMRPGGRFIASVPYDWSDESSEDLNPFDLHVYSKKKLVELIRSRFRIECLHVQNVGGGYKNPTARKAIFEVSADAPEEDGEWLLVVAYKDVVEGAGDSGFIDTIYPYPNPTRNLLSFKRDYDNPWLMRTLFGMGVRITNRDERLKLSERILASSHPATADHGAALCVLGYCLSEKSPDDASLSEYIARANSYVTSDYASLHSLRWQVSIQFLIGTLEQNRGNDRLAEDAYLSVLASNWQDFSPTLATKAAESALRIGLIRRKKGDVSGAREVWKKGLSVAFDVLRSDIEELVGDVECPLPDAFPESISALDIARKCGDCLRMTSRWNSRSTYATWKSIIDDRGLDRLRNAVVTQQMREATRDASRWRRLRTVLYGNRLAVFALRISRGIRRRT